MSFVICVCGMNFSTLMSDGRMVKLPNNIVVREDVSKVLKINSNVAMAYTGDPIPTQFVLKRLNLNILKDLSMEDIESIIINQLRQLDSNILGVKLIFTGRNNEGKFVIHTLNSEDNFSINPIYPLNKRITYACAGNNEILCNSVIQRNFSDMQIKNGEQLEHIMSKCIYDIAKFDETVNTNIFKVVIN